MNQLFLDGSKLIHHLDAVSAWRANLLRFPLHMEISPSAGCNQRCTLCCVDYLGHKHKLLPEDLLVKLVNEMKENGVRSFLLAGEGEPTLNPAIVPMIQQAKDQNLDAALNTNGVLLKREISQSILPGLQWLRFSIQASNSFLYQQIHRGCPADLGNATANIAAAVEIKRQLNLDVTIGIQQILLPENSHDVFATAKLARDLGVDYYVVKRFSQHPENAYSAPDDLYLTALDSLKQIETLNNAKFRTIVRWNNFELDCYRKYTRCHGIGFIAHVLSDGGIYPCSQYFHRDKYCYGNLSGQSFREIFLSPRAYSIQQNIREQTEVSSCMSYCRHHGTNQFLSRFENEPEHVEFI